MKKKNTLFADIPWLRWATRSERFSQKAVYSKFKRPPAFVTKQYNLVPAKWRWCCAVGKVTAGLPESNGSLPPRGWLTVTVTCGLTVCTPGSAPGPTLGIEYRKPLPFYLVNLRCFYSYVYFDFSSPRADNYFAFVRDAKHCNQRVLCVRLSVHSHISKTTHPNFTKF